ncbi:cytochrome d ubiquinol oxidase subunit II [Nonomuraea sp. NPDC059194]|uniref:cytochrome d ubiquinol oxidase subunit II n=1 Tax=Nonomuraea sp. NPDC059194 TaxID=3346764 RepID=UPI00367404BF
MEIFILAFFAIGYFVLAGADIGVGMLLPYLGKNAAERRTVIAAIAPFFLGNEVWLVALAGVLAGLFPSLEGELLAGNYLALVALLVGWIVRDMGLWLRGRVPGAWWQAFWDGAIVAGSWALALAWGVIFTQILPVPIVAAAVVALLFATHGLAFAGVRLSGELRERAVRLTGGSGEGRTYALTAAALTGIVLLAGADLELAASAADSATLALLVPVILVLMPLLVAAQGWVWWTFRARVTGPSYL